MQGRDQRSLAQDRLAVLVADRGSHSSRAQGKKIAGLLVPLINTCAVLGKRSRDLPRKSVVRHGLCLATRVATFQGDHFQGRGGSTAVSHPNAGPITTAQADCSPLLNCQLRRVPTTNARQNDLDRDIARSLTCSNRARERCNRRSAWEWQQRSNLGEFPRNHRTLAGWRMRRPRGRVMLGCNIACGARGCYIIKSRRQVSAGNF